MITISFSIANNAYIIHWNNKILRMFNKQETAIWYCRNQLLLDEHEICYA